MGAAGRGEGMVRPKPRGFSLVVMPGLCAALCRHPRPTSGGSKDDGRDIGRAEATPSFGRLCPAMDGPAMARIAANNKFTLAERSEPG